MLTTAANHVMGLRTVLLGSPCRLTKTPLFPRACMFSLHARSYSRPIAFPKRPVPSLCRHLPGPFTARRLFWSQKSTPQAHDHFNGPSDGQEEAAKVAILEKVMKGRQPTDLMLRCEFSAHVSSCWG